MISNKERTKYSVPVPLFRCIRSCVALLFFGVVAGAAPNSDTNIWWSLRPLVRPPVPVEEAGQNPIDSFLLAKLKTSGLAFSPEASRQTLIRRVYFDLIGLPPAPEEVDRFVYDADPRAYENLIDRLLDLPAYGERWARHWLDVVHYGDTHGYDKDKPRPNAWPYRDYVIRAFNQDRSYSRFVQEQIGGDVLFPDTRDGIEALGFISAGAWDFIGHAEVPETKIDGRIARHLDRDDMIANTINTFNSLTVQCAQCHNHKFDPIPSEDYYKLQAVFAAVDRTDREYYGDPELNRKRSELAGRRRSLESEKKSVEEKIASDAGAEFAELKKKLEAARKPSTEAKHPPEFGYHSAIESREDAAKWVQVDLGKIVPLQKIVLRPCWDDFAGLGDGFGFPRRYKVEISANAEFTAPEIIYEKTATDQPNPGTEPQTATLDSKPARFIRVTATKLAPRQGDFIFALAELEAVDVNGENVARKAPVAALDSIEAPVRWTKSNLTDGIYPGHARKSSSAEIAALETAVADLLKSKVSEETRTRWSITTNQLASVQSEFSAMPRPMVAFVGSVHYGSGAFRGTGPDGGQPRKICILPRGDVRHPGKEVSPGALSALAEIPSTFDLGDAPEGERRKALALWLTESRNPLTWRSIVNRIWQYHFGRGLVGTPNDFGRMGEQPSHPDLLDWLAVEFRDGGQSFKKLHKLILTSVAYRQTSSLNPATDRAAEIDAENRLLWRANRRKLEAEAVRDAVLCVSGQLDPRMYGPGFQDFIVEKPEHSPHYEYEKFDPDDLTARRRSIYRFIVRSQQQPFMTTLDCADPSMLVARRNESVSPLQALALLNNSFILAMADAFARRLKTESPDITAQVAHAFSLALSRPASPTELAELSEFARKNGLPNACRLLFNLNEFAFAD